MRGVELHPWGVSPNVARAAVEAVRKVVARGGEGTEETRGGLWRAPAIAVGGVGRRGVDGVGSVDVVRLLMVVGNVGLGTSDRVFDVLHRRNGVSEVPLSENIYRQWPLVHSRGQLPAEPSLGS